MLSINDMQYLVALVQEKHFGRAATRCNVSQPALSFAIAKLENTLGFLLCERLSSGICITPEGIALAAESEKVLSRINNIHALIAADKDLLQSPIHLGCSQSLGAYIYPQVLLQCQHQQQVANLYLHEKPDALLIENLHSNQLDAVLIADSHAIKGCVVRELVCEPWQVVLPAPHPLSLKESLSLSDLSEQRVFIAENEHAKMAEQLGDKVHLEKVSSNETLRGLVVAQAGWGLMPFIAANSQLYANHKWILRNIPEIPPRTIYLIWRASYPGYKIMEFLSQAIKASAEWHLNFVAPEQHQMLGLDYLQR